MLEALPPKMFDEEISDRIAKCSIVTDLIDYRFRYMQNGGSDPNASNLNHAKFFRWWPTRNIPGQRGVQTPGKAVSLKTTHKWWQRLESSAEFLYLNDHYGFSQLPPETNNSSFVDHLISAANNTDEIRRFFGTYAFVKEIISPAQTEILAKTIPPSLPRVQVKSKPFTDEELSTISAYDDNYLSMAD